VSAGNVSDSVQLSSLTQAALEFISPQVKRICNSSDEYAGTDMAKLTCVVGEFDSTVSVASFGGVNSFSTVVESLEFEQPVIKNALISKAQFNRVDGVANDIKVIAFNIFSVRSLYYLCRLSKMIRSNNCFGISTVVRANLRLLQR
jgi:hypothetical protein